MSLRDHRSISPPPSQRTPLFVSILVCFLLVADGALVLYATLIWPTADRGEEVSQVTRWDKQKLEFAWGAYN
jgi:hypothetical protein